MEHAERIRRERSNTLDLRTAGLVELFQAIDVNGDGKLSRDEFVRGILNIPYVDISETEARRLFENLDPSSCGYVSLGDFYTSSVRWRWLRSVVATFMAFKNCTYAVPADYDYTKETCVNYSMPPGEYVGDFVKTRRERDYKFHNNYTPERQLWQDMAVTACLGRTEAQARPWAVYTCGPMGVGKGHVLSWLSRQGLFPIEYVVHVDPDFFKRIMPEWKGYVSYASRSSQEEHDEESAAGTMCHRESAFLQEIAMEAAMSERQNVWIDGSLSNGPWFSMEFDDIRKRFPHYRIAIIYITASEATVRARIEKRSRETGRTIPEREIVRSLQSPEESIRLLAPKTDLVVRITNESTIKLCSVEDYSGNWHQGLYKHFGVISHQHPSFPDWLGPLYFANTSLVGEPFVTVTLPTTMDEKGSEIMSGFLEKEGHLLPNWKSRWFELKPGKLSYFSKKVDRCSRGEWLRGDCVITRACTVTMGWETPPPSANPLSFQRSGSGNFLLNMLNTQTRFVFNITGKRSDGSRVSLTLDAGSEKNRLLWVDAIEKQIQTATRIESMEMGYFNNSHTTIRLTPSAMINSPNLILFHQRHPDFCFSATKVSKVMLGQSERDLAGVHVDTTHFRWIYPCQMVKEADFDGIDTADPDIELVRYGGLVGYGSDGEVIAVRALSAHRTPHMMLFGEPESLKPEDAERLHAGERWMPVTDKTELASGAKYKTFILPYEELPSRRYPAVGCSAYIFREPEFPPDHRDRYFTPLVEF